MTKDVKRLFAVLEAHLFESGVPVVSLLKRKAGQGDQHFIACAIPDDDGDLDYYFVVQVGRQHLIRYFLNQCDLRFLFAFASGRKFFTAKSLTPNRTGKIELVEFNGRLTEDLFPDGQFFAVNHTSDYGITYPETVEQRLYIDGSWDMDEFGEFYTKFSDVYGFEQAIIYYQSGQQSKVNAVRKAFATKPFKGGSSYMGFFDDLIDIIPRNERPSLDGISYNSPGHVDLKGRDEILALIKNNVSLFLQNHAEIVKRHDDLRGFMSRSKLLMITGKTVVASKEVLEQLISHTNSLFEVLPVSGADEILDLAERNQVVRAKIGLALFRRLKATSTFFAQGRLAYKE